MFSSKNLNQNMPKIVLFILNL